MKLYGPPKYFVQSEFSNISPIGSRNLIMAMPASIPRRPRKIFITEEEEDAEESEDSEEYFIQLFFDILFRTPADEGGDGLTAFEEDEGRNAHDVECAGNIDVFIHVDLHELHLARVFLVEFLKDRIHRLAWSAPRCPEIDEHGNGRFQDFFLKIGVGDGGRHRNVRRSGGV